MNLGSALKSVSPLKKVASKDVIVIGKRKSISSVSQLIGLTSLTYSSCSVR